MSKHFLMGGESDFKSSIEEKTVVSNDEIQAIMKNDGYDDLRKKAMSHEYQSKRENALKEIEREIEKQKKIRNNKVPVCLMKPLDDRVIIYPDKPLSITEAGIFIPQSASEKEIPDTGVVVATGPGRNINGIFNPVNLKTGDRVYYGKYAGIKITDVKSGEEFLIMRYTDIFCLE